MSSCLSARQYFAVLTAGWFITFEFQYAMCYLGTYLHFF